MRLFELRRVSRRLPGHDYRRPGTYFVTVVTHGRLPLLAERSRDSLTLTPFGVIVRACWDALPLRFRMVVPGTRAVLPDHVHGLLRTGAGEVTSPAARPSLGQIVAFFKYVTTKTINDLRGCPGERLWQRGYYDVVVPTDAVRHAIEEYIRLNPTTHQNGEAL